MRSLLTLLSLLVVAAAGRAEGTAISSGRSRVALVELYTSEGCSSCPPADRWLGGLRKTDGLWKNFVPVAFHISYWDHLGWTDRFASEAFTRRQYDYADSWSSHGVYTPCFVKDGAEWHPGGSLPEAESGAPGVLTVTPIDGKTYRVTFAPTGKGFLGLDVHVALLGGGIHSKVTAGENDGATLAHEFVVMDLKTAGLAKNADGTSYETTVRLDSPAEKEAPRLAVAAWVTHSGSLEPVQAAGGWLRQ
jgi:hypothetical protein